MREYVERAICGMTDTTATEESCYVVDEDTLYYIDYRCRKCGQVGTARFTRKDMESNDEGYPVPKKTMYCCECKSPDVDIEEIAEC